MRARLVLATLLGLALSHGVKGEDCKCGKEGQRDISMLMPYLSNGKVSQDKACELAEHGRCEWNANDARHSVIQFNTIKNDDFQPAVLDKIKSAYGYGRTNYGKEENPYAYKYGPANYLFYADGSYPLPNMFTHGKYRVNESWRKDEGETRYRERVAGDCAYVGNFYKVGLNGESPSFHLQYFNIPIMKYRTNECDVSECDENKRPLDKADTTWFYLNLEIIERINENGVETEICRCETIPGMNTKEEDEENTFCNDLEKRITDRLVELEAEGDDFKYDHDG